MRKEEWQPVQSLPGLSASTKGRLRVEPYTSRMPNGGERVYGGFEGFGQWDGKRFIFRFAGKTFKVARLICEAFKGPPPEALGGRVVCMHMDENSRNNCPSNLEWGVQKANLNAPGFLDYCRSRTGDKNPRLRGERKRLAAADQQTQEAPMRSE